MIDQKPSLDDKASRVAMTRYRRRPGPDSRRHAGPRTDTGWARPCRHRRHGDPAPPHRPIALVALNGVLLPAPPVWHDRADDAWPGRERCEEHRIVIEISTIDTVAIIVFVVSWILYSVILTRMAGSGRTLSSAMDIQRRQWMRTMMHRDLRMIDTGIMSGLQNGTAFFASTSLLAIGGVLALLALGRPCLASSRPALRDGAERALPGSSRSSG